MNESERDMLIRNEQAAIERAKEQRAIARLKPWQIKAAYYLAMLNNQSVANGRTAVTLTMEVGDIPTITVLNNGTKKE